jgi:hypothetical protein
MLISLFSFSNDMAAAAIESYCFLAEKRGDKWHFEKNLALCQRK